MYRLEIALLAAALFACCGQAAGLEHCIYDVVSLDGAWEMAYQPYAWETVDEPAKCGVRVENAVPGYWEDMTESFRAAGMTVTLESEKRGSVFTHSRFFCFSSFAMASSRSV